MKVIVYIKFFVFNQNKSAISILKKLHRNVIDKLLPFLH